MIYLQLNKEHPPTGYWDHYLIHDIENQTDTNRIAVIPGAFQAEYVDGLNEAIANLGIKLVILTSDEEQRFPAEKLKCPVWSQYGDYRGVAKKIIPIGPAPNPPTPEQDKTIDYFFAGQVTTPNRMELAQVMKVLKNHEIVQTAGFGQGAPKEDYNVLMGMSKIVPCPAGPHSPDSFRLYEALEAGCTPVVKEREFFTKLFRDFPFPCINSWEELASVEYRDYSQWWADFKNKLVEDLWTAQQ